MSIFDISKKKLSDVVKSSISQKEVLRKLGFLPAGQNHKSLINVMKTMNIDYSHFTSQPRKRKSTTKRYRTEEILCKDSPWTSSYSVKNRILKENLLPYACNKCGINEWQGSKITLQLDHINGVSDDNRISNLRLLCPNCHSQTSTWCGRNIKNKKYEKTPCIECGAELRRESTRCSDCSRKRIDRPKKIEWPDLRDLINMVKLDGYSGTGRKLNVSDNAVKKHIKLREPTALESIKLHRQGHAKTVSS